MEIRGHVQNGVVILDGSSPLPEGAAVSVVYPAPTRAVSVVEKQRVELPLVRSERPGSVHLTSQRIAEILDAEDAVARR